MNRKPEESVRYHQTLSSRVGSGHKTRIKTVPTRVVMFFALSADFTVLMCSSSVQLARRVLQLERLNCSLRKDLETEGNKTASLQEEVTM